MKSIFHKRLKSIIHIFYHQLNLMMPLYYNSLANSCILLSSVCIEKDMAMEPSQSKNIHVFGMFISNIPSTRVVLNHGLTIEHQQSHQTRTECEHCFGGGFKSLRSVPFSSV